MNMDYDILNIAVQDVTEQINRMGTDMRITP